MEYELMSKRVSPTMNGFVTSKEARERQDCNINIKYHKFKKSD